MRKEMKFPNILIVGFILLTQILTAQNPYLSETWEKIELGESLGNRGLFSIDLDNDGIEEIIATGIIQSNSYFSVLEIKNNELRVKWSSRLYEAGSWFNTGIQKIKAFNLDGDNDYEVYVMLDNGTIECYDGTTMQLVSIQELNYDGADDFFFEDIDNDGEIEFIVSCDDWDIGLYTNVYDAATYTLEWRTSDYGCEDIGIGDVDNDGVKEIVLANGYIFDGITHEEDWIYSNGFGEEIEIADINDDQIPEIIGGKNDSIIVYNAQNKQLLWRIFTDEFFDGICVSDFEGDGEIEIIFGGWDFNGLKCYSASNQGLLWQVNDNYSSGVTNIFVGDPDNDSEMEVLWGNGQRSSGADHLCISSASTGEIELKNADLDGYFSFDISDIDKNGQYELIIASRETNNYYNGGIVFLYEGLSHDIIHILDSISYTSPISCIKVANINDTEQDEIIIGYSDGYGYKSILILDGLSYEILFENNDLGSIYSMDVADIDNDSVMEIVFGNHASIVRVMNGETFEIEWETESIHWVEYYVRQILLENIDDDPALEVIYWTNNDFKIHIYDGETHMEQAQSDEFEEMTAIDVADINLDSRMEFCIGDENGNIITLNSSLDSVLSQFSLTNEMIGGLKVVNIDSTIEKEILCGGSKLKIFSSNEHSLLWESKRLINNENFWYLIQDIEIFDLDNDNNMDIFYSNERGLFQFECNSTYIDYSIDFVNPDVIWSVASTYPNGNSQNPNFIETTTRTYGYIGDTLIENIKWSKIYSSQDSNFSSSFTYLGNIIKENGLVIYMDTTNSIDTIYNFNLLVGDSVSYALGSGDEYLVINNIDSVLINGEFCKRFHFEEPNYSPEFLKESWIEGVGSIHGPLFPSNPKLFQTEIPDSTNLTCYKINNSILWSNTFYDDCYINITLSTKDIVFENLKIFPNPVKNKLRIEIPEDKEGKYNILIYDLFGKLILNKIIDQNGIIEINTSTLDNGLYILQIEDDNQKYRQKFIKQ